MRANWRMVEMLPNKPYLMRGEWFSIRLKHRHGGEATITLHYSKKRRWRWTWSENWLGKQHQLRSPSAFRYRQDCIDNLCHALEMFGWDDLAEAVMSWE